MNLSPKQRFLESSEQVNKHLDLTNQPHVLHSLEVAVAEMVSQLPTTNNPGASWSNAAKIEGATQFINIWLQLGEKFNPQSPVRSSVLQTIPQKKT